MIGKMFSQLRLVVLTVSLLLIQLVAKSQLTTPSSITFLENTVNAAFEPIFPIANSSYANGGTVNFAGKTLSVIYVNQAGTAVTGISTDQLGVKNVGTGTGEVNVVLGNPNTVKVGSTTVATYPSSLSNSGVSGENLLLTWIGSPSLAQVNAVLNHIGYQTTSDNPSSARYIKITILDGSSTISFNKLLTVTAENDAPRAGANTVRSDITAPSDPILIWPSGSTTPGSEGVGNVIDNNTNTKYLNWGSGSSAPPNSGFVVTPASGATVVTKLTFFSANDESGRDPVTYKLEGSRDGGGSYTTIVNSGNTNLSTTRFALSESAEFSNQEWYSSYRLTFPQLRTAGSMMQIGEVEMLGVPFQRVVYTIGVSSPVLIHNLLSVTDVDNNDQIQSATVNISTNFNQNDVLTWTNQTGITGSYNSTTGVLSFTGTASPSVYQTLLRSIKFNTAAPNSVGKERLVKFQVVDAAGLSSNFAEARVIVSFPPTLTSVTNLGAANRTFSNTITYAMLSSAAQNFTDPDAEDLPLKFKIKSIGTNGTLTKGGTAVSVGEVVATGESLVWTPSTNASNVVVMSVRAFDGDLESSANVNVTMDVQNIPAPVITSFSPTTAGNGESVVITGTNFSGATSVKFGNVNATSFVVNSNTQITAVVGAAASGDVYVQNTSGNDTEGGFTFKVVEYKFENNVLDETNANLDGTVVGTATYSPGANGQAICFTSNAAMTSLSNYLRLPSDLIRGRGTNFTVSLRFKTATFGAILGYQATAVNGSGAHVPILYVQEDGKLSANLWQLNLGRLSVISSGRVDDNNWHKVEFSVAPGSITVYIDGVLAGSTSGTIDHLTMSFNQLGSADITGVWGGITSGGWIGFTGCIDEFLIVDKALTASQIQQVTALPQPTITSFTPTTAKSGETVTITGTNFGSASSVKLGGVEARRFTIVSSTEIRAIVPFNATLNSTIEVTTAAGTISGTTFTFDCNNNAIDFDGVNDFVQIGAPLPITTTGNFTIEAWVRPSLIDANFHGFFGLETQAGRAPSLYVGPNGTLYADAYNSTNINDRYLSQIDNFFTLNTWVHVALVRNGNTFIIYKNGVQVGTRTAPASVNLPNANFWIGRVDNYLAGSMDEVRVWTTARTAQQILSGMGTELVGNESGLIAYYNFNQGVAAGTNSTITTLNNLTSATNLNGTLTNINRTGATSNFVSGVWPAIITQPTATSTFCSGGIVSLTVSAVGPQLTYQWYSNASASNTGGTAIAGATASTYTYTTTTVGSQYFYVVVTGACSQSVTSTVSTVVVNATNWTKIYETTNPSRDGSGEIVYTSGFGKTGGVASTHNGSFNRIKYRLQNNVAGTLRWAEVSFDAWTNVTLADLQIPDLVNNLVFQRNVSNIEVSSNMPGVHTGNFSTGRLEFWNQNYGTNRSGLTPAGDANTFDWDDLLAGTTNGHGSFQIHNVSPEKEQTIFAWNMHRNGGPPEIGIGNAPTGHPDWTFNTTNGSGNFKVEISVQNAPIITPNGSVSTCVGIPVTLTATTGASYLWSNGETTQSISTANVGNYTVTVTQANGCASTSIPKTVTLATPPAAATITGTQNVCINGITQFIATGESGALTFNGTTNIVETANNISALNITGDITVETWVKVNQLPNDWVRLVGKGDASNRTYGFWLATNGQLLWQIYGNGTDPALFSTVALQTGTWYHIAATRVGNVHTIYINGVARGSVTASITPSSSTLPLTLGYHGSIHTYLNGQMDEVRVWNVGRTATQINQNKDVEIAAQSGLVAYYKFNQGTAGGNNAGLTTLIDDSGNGNNGTLGNFALIGNASNWSSRSGVPTTAGSWTSSNTSVATVSSTGVVTGIAAGNATITFTLAGSGGCANVSSTRTITVNPLPIISYPSSTYSVERTKAITSIQPTVTGIAASSFTITPALPTGLSFNTTNGSISGTPSVVSASATYTVNGIAPTGCVGTTTFTLNVFNAVAPSALSFAPGSQTVRQGTAITNMVPTASGGAVASYSISPALPAGLSFNTTTGIISGTLTAQQTGTVTYTITATNSGGSTTATVTLVYNTAPTDVALSSTSVAENAASGTAVASLSATDADAGDTHTYTLVSGSGDTDNASFTITGTTLSTAAVFDFETKSSYSVRVRVTDAGGLSFEKAFTIGVTNVNEAPTNISASASLVAENAASGTSVAALSATDIDAGETFTYTLVSGTGDTDNASFAITGTTLSTAAVFDFETKSSYSVRVQVTDAGGLSFEKVFTISVTDVNDAPTNISASASSVAENAASGTAVGTLVATDADAGDTHTYTLVSGTGDTDNASFAITGTTLSTAAVFDFETKSSYSIRVQVTDAGGLSFEKVFTISVTDVNEAPTALALSNASVLENAASGTTVGTLAGTDADAGDTHTYTLVSGTGSTDNASFTITGTTLSTAAVFNFEAKNSYSVRVRVTDAGGLSFERAFTISVTDVNEAPTLTAITDRRVYNVSTSQVVNLAGITAGPETAQSTTTTVSTDKPATFSSISVVGTQIQFTLAAGIVTPQDVVVTVRVKDNGGVANGGVDSVVRTFKLGIDPMPVASATPNLITLGATSQLSATGANAVNYTWVAVGGSGIVGSGATINVRPKGTTTYAVVVTNSFGYQATVPVLLTVIVDYKLVPNNLVTPNGDGVNDKWVIPNIDMYPDNEVMVYDKAGRAVFAKRGYNNEWDGTVNGKLLKEDAYFYVIKFNKDGALPIRGYVSIVR